MHSHKHTRENEHTLESGEVFIRKERRKSVFIARLCVYTRTRNVWARGSQGESQRSRLRANIFCSERRNTLYNVANNNGLLLWVVFVLHAILFRLKRLERTKEIAIVPYKRRRQYLRRPPHKGIIRFLYLYAATIEWNRKISKKTNTNPEKNLVCT